MDSEDWAVWPYLVGSKSQRKPPECDPSLSISISGILRERSISGRRDVFWSGDCLLSLVGEMERIS